MTEFKYMYVYLLDLEATIDPAAPYQGFFKTYIFWNPIHFP